MRALIFVATLLSISLFACDAKPTSDEAPPEPPEPAEPAVPASAEPPPSIAAPSPEPTPSEPPTPAFDPGSAGEAKVRLVAVHRDATWVPCGVSHSTGVVEVEVLEVGEPPPRMLLIISCPADFGHRELLEVGAVLRVELFGRRQSWPRPWAERKLPAELPRRYVKSLARADPDE